MNNSISSSIAIFICNYQQSSNAEMEALETCAEFIKQYQLTTTANSIPKVLCLNKYKLLSIMLHVIFQDTCKLNLSCGKTYKLVFHPKHAVSRTVLKLCKVDKG